MELYNGKVVCPRCDGNGLICKYKVEDLKIIIYICDECDASWLDEDVSLDRFQDLTTFLETKGIKYKDAQIVDLGYGWFKT